MDRYIHAARLTAATFVAQVGKSPDVAETNGIADAGQHKLHFIRPMRPSGLPIITRIIRIAVVIAGARGEFVLETAKMRGMTSSFCIANIAKYENQRGMRKKN